MGAAEQQDQVVAVVRRFAEVAPPGWVHLVGSWEATPTDGEVNLNWITTAVVNGGDRWLYGQVGYDAELYDAVVRLNDMSATGPGERWTTLEVRVEQDGSFTTEFGYGPAKRTQGIHDAESMGRYETYLDAWVALHGPTPPAADGDR